MRKALVILILFGFLRVAEANLLLQGVGGAPEGKVTAAGGITFDNKNGTSGATVTGLTVSSYVVGAGNNKILVACVVAEDASDVDMTILSISWNTTELFTQAVQQLDTGDKATIWYLLNPTSATANIVVTFTGTVSSAGVGVASFFGVAQSGQPDNIATEHDTTAGTTSLVAITPVANNCLVARCFNKRTAAGAITAYDSPTVEIFTADITNCDLGSSYDILVGGAGSSSSKGVTQGSSANENCAATFSPF